MSAAIRICLILGSFFSVQYMLRRIRKAQVQIEDTIFWLIFSILLMVLSLYQFAMTIRISQMDSKVRKLAQRVALNEEKIEREKDL